MATVEIRDVLKKGQRNYNKKDGGQGTVYSVLASAVIDGEEHKAATIETFQKETADQLVAGWKGSADKRDYKGETSYTVQGQGGGGGRFGNKRPYDPYGSEAAKLPGICLTAAVAWCGAQVAKGEKVGTKELDIVANHFLAWAQSRLVMTRDLMARATASSPAATQPARAPAVASTGWQKHVTEDAEKERVSLGITDASLSRLWTQTNGDVTAFKEGFNGMCEVALNKQRQSEEGGDDTIPF